MSSRTCIIIGATGGIGRALSERLRDRGWNLMLCGRREEPLRELAETLGAQYRIVDATDFAQVQDAFAATPDLRGAVNLAGSILLKPAHSTGSDDFEDTIRANLRTAFSVVRAAGMTMRANGGGVVLMSSCAAAVGLANHEAISAAKAGVEGLARSAAATYAGAGLRFNVVAPGLTDTPLAARITKNEASLAASKAMHPLGRIGDPHEIARAIEFLIDPENSWITGQVIGVDGGLARVKTR
jgi:NAD(P)-dependent dehydrogenase (short-subunit alcohol dehydrogenase family)